MNFRSFLLALIISGLLIPHTASAQSESRFDLDKYKRFLHEHQDLDVDDLMGMYPADRFLRATYTDYQSAAFYKDIDALFKLTDYEKDLLYRHGFMVSERISRTSFAEALKEVYMADLPVYVGSDAILHAIHMSYDAILISLETSILRPQVAELLAALRSEIPALEQRYSAHPAMAQKLRDLDVYLTVPMLLLGTTDAPHYAENISTINKVMTAIESEQTAMMPLFSDEPRKLDFSQFTVRGHYTDTEELSTYFQCMMWLGRTEIYLAAPKEATSGPSESDVQRQVILSALISEAAESANVFPLVENIENVLVAFIGEQDNVTLAQVGQVLRESGVADAAALLDMRTTERFQQALAEKPFAGQAILSQILMSDPMSPEQIEPASAFLLLGQRFVIDSYVTGNVVYDKAMFQGMKIKRMLPSSQDVLFAMGNNSSAQLLQEEMTRFPYASNLAGLRYLVDQYESDFWESSVYNAWLASIRSLNPPLEREGFPAFMQTAAWWQQKMNTQLAAWAQLRHDNLLYAKQSYTGGVGCEYPEAYVEPVPAFYEAVATFARRARASYDAIRFEDTHTKQSMINYFSTVEDVMDRLAAIAQKELAGDKLDAEETDWLKRMIYDEPQGCTVEFGGWYTSLYYGGSTSVKEADYIIADVHTAPTDAEGNMVGWVVHVGTGPINMAVIVVDNCHGNLTAYAGPVMSYYEYTSLNFKRNNDEEWQQKVETGDLPQRPEFVNLYLADSNGEPYGNPGYTLMLKDLTNAGETPQADARPIRLHPNYPNPFSQNTHISFSITGSVAYTPLSVKVYDLHGQLVNTLFMDALPAGTYSVRWDARDASGQAMESGVYVYEISAGGETVSSRMVLAR